MTHHSYVLMLLVMMFDWWIFVAVVFGLASGRLYTMRTTFERRNRNTNTSKDERGTGDGNSKGTLHLGEQFNGGGSGGGNNHGNADSDDGFALDAAGGTPCCDAP